MTRIAVLGASGFVGSAVADAAVRQGHDVLRLSAPRLKDHAGHAGEVASLAMRLDRMDVVVNCAGNPDASAADFNALSLVNAVLPGVLGAAAHEASVPRFVHVSSAVVQGRRPVLDSSDSFDGFSPYAVSKIEGERAARAHGPRLTTVYRPPSVHGPTRRVTKQLAAIARSPMATVAAPGDRPTPQAHIDDVAGAILTLATSPIPPPEIVHHPWQGHTTTSLLTMLADGQPPRMIPASMARGALTMARTLGRISPRVAPYARRLEMVWMGQEQGPSWLTQQGWRPCTTEEDWVLLGRQVRGSQADGWTARRSGRS